MHTHMKIENSKVLVKTTENNKKMQGNYTSKTIRLLE